MNKQENIWHFKWIREVVIRSSNLVNEFYSRAFDGHTITWLNRFLGVGLLKELEDHFTKSVNSIIVYDIGFNRDNFEDTDIYTMTLEEAIDLRKCLDITIKKLKIIFDNLTFRKKLIEVENQ